MLGDSISADPDAPHGVVGDIVDASTAGGLGADPLESPPAEVKTRLGEPVGDEDVTSPLRVGGDQSSSKSASDEIDEFLVMRASAEALGERRLMRCLDGRVHVLQRDCGRMHAGLFKHMQSRGAASN